MENNRKDAVRTITLLSLSHAAVDFICVFSLFRSFADIRDAFFLYNFCAFALQMPLGIILDILETDAEKKGRHALLFTLAGMILTIAGSLLSPVVSGIGNAFFHCGGGVLTIRKDSSAALAGRGLGVFVAPGAFGVTFGILLNGSAAYPVLLAAACLFLSLCGILLYVSRREVIVPPAETIDKKEMILIPLVCFLAVILRSLGGMAVAFSWKEGVFLTLSSTFCVASGKAAGGFLSASCGTRRVIFLSLILSALCFVFGNDPYFGHAALFFFNMTMPVTLYLAASALPDMPGAAFGLLTFALFLGWLPVRNGTLAGLAPFPAGTAVSLLSLFIMSFALGKKSHG